MKDGFDRSVAERMPKMQKRRPNRPWNVDPVLIRTRKRCRNSRPCGGGQARAAAPAPSEAPDTTSSAIARRWRPSKICTRNSRTSSSEEGHPRRLMDMTGSWKSSAGKHHAQGEHRLRSRRPPRKTASSSGKSPFRTNSSRTPTITSSAWWACWRPRTPAMIRGHKTRALEERLRSFSRDIQEKAKLDVKVSILEKDLNFSTARIHELEEQLEEGVRKRKPLEDEIAELKVALDRVYSSLSHIRLKAKREVYGS